MVNLCLISVLCLNIVLLTRTTNAQYDEPLNTNGPVKFRMTSRLAESLCAQRSTFGRTETLQPPQKTKLPGENFNECISYYKVKGSSGGMGMRAVCNAKQVLKINDPRFRQLTEPFLSRQKKSSETGVPCTLDPADDLGRSGRRNESYLWKFRDNLCFMPILFPHCLGKPDDTHPCLVLPLFVNAVRFLVLLNRDLILDFIHADKISPFFPNYLHVLASVNDIGCLTFIGKKGGRQNMAFGPGCGEFKTVLHELGHSLGIGHEHNRFDRDKHIEIFLDNVIQSPFFLSQFDIEKGGEWNTFGIPYNIKSIMHYNETAFAQPGKMSMKSKNGDPLGDGDVYQPLDQDMREALYGDCVYQPIVPG